MINNVCCQLFIYLSVSSFLIRFKTIANILTKGRKTKDGNSATYKDKVANDIWNLFVLWKIFEMNLRIGRNQARMKARQQHESQGQNGK